MILCMGTSSRAPLFQEIPNFRKPETLNNSNVSRKYSTPAPFLSARASSTVGNCCLKATVAIIMLRDVEECDYTISQVCVYAVFFARSLSTGCFGSHPKP